MRDEALETDRVSELRIRFTRDVFGHRVGDQADAGESFVRSFAQDGAFCVSRGDWTGGFFIE